MEASRRSTWILTTALDPFGNHNRISQPNAASPDEVKATYESANP